MDLDRMKWLDMVWSALAEEDAARRAEMLDSAHSFLEQTRGLFPESVRINELAGSLSP